MEHIKMARSKSAVLSPADKKAVITDMKARLKVAQNTVKESAKAIAASAKIKAAAVKVAEKNHAALEKEHTKVLTVAQKAADKLVADLAAVQPQAV